MANVYSIFDIMLKFVLKTLETCNHSCLSQRLPEFVTHAPQPLVLTAFRGYGTGGTRTLDLPLRRRSLYPTELQPQMYRNYDSKPRTIERSFS